MARDQRCGSFWRFGGRWAAAGVIGAALMVGCGGSPLSGNGTGGSPGSGGGPFASGGASGTGGGGGFSASGGASGTGSGGGPSASGGASGTGGAPAPTGGSSGSFSWTLNGQTFSTTGYYLASPFDASPGGTFAIYSNYAALAVPCNLRGRFATVLPPVGTYPIGNALQPIETDSFIGVCNSSFQESNVSGDQSLSGEVALTKSAPNDVEGTFTMTAAPVTAGSGGQSGANTYTGAFAITSAVEP